LFFSLELIIGHTHKIADEAKDVKKNRTLCYEYKNFIFLEKKMLNMQQSIIGGIPLR
jgi:hypothetical protein